MDVIFQFSTLVLLNRVSCGVISQPAKVQRLTHDAFAALSQLSSCERQFPIFVLGCEAQTDQQRKIVLDIISRTEGTLASRNFNQVKQLLESIWAQDELADGQARDHNYWNRLLCTTSRCTTTPCFA